MSLREENANIVLAELLTEKGLKALGEVILRKRGGRLEPDVLIELSGVRIVIEGKKHGMWDALVEQCKDRLDNNVCDLCVMVEYADIKLGKLVPDQLDVKDALSRADLMLASFLMLIGLVWIDGLVWRQSPRSI